MNLKVSYQSWVLGGCLLVVVFTLVFVGIVTHSFLREDMLGQISRSYRGELSLLKVLVRDRWPSGPLDPARIDSLADSLGKDVKVRVTVIAWGGAVLGDSDVPLADLARLDNHAERPEIKQARESGRGSSIRRSATLGLDLLYLADRLDIGENTRLVIRLAVPLSKINQSLAQLRRLIMGAVFMGVLLSLLVAYVVARQISRPVKELTRTAGAIAAGDLSQRFRIYPKHEIGALGRAFDQMADNLEARIDDVTRGRDMLAAILQGMWEGVLVIDGQGRTLLINDALNDLLGLAQEPGGRQISEIIRNAELLEALRAVRGGQAHVWLEMRTLGKSPRFLEVNVVRLTYGKDMAGAVAVLHDITERKHTEQVLRDFVANVSHELRTPLTAIRGSAETLVGGAIDHPEDGRRFAEIIARQVLRMENLASDLLELASLESGESAPQLEPITAEEMADLAHDSIGEMAEEKGLSLEMDLPKGSFEFRADHRQIEQAVLNLLNNAVKYTPEGGKVVLSLRRQAGEVIISVTDNGIGVAKEHLPRIFGRFYRVDKERSREMGGTGLGLAIVKHIARGHGGRVEVESRPGKGSTFRVILPDA